MANDNQQTKTKYATFSVLFFFVICSLTMIVVEADEGGHIEQQEQEEESPQIGLSSAALTNGVGLERVVKEENEAEEEEITLPQQQKRSPSSAWRRHGYGGRVRSFQSMGPSDFDSLLVHQRYPMRGSGGRSPYAFTRSRKFGFWPPGRPSMML